MQPSSLPVRKKAPKTQRKDVLGAVRAHARTYTHSADRSRMAGWRARSYTNTGPIYACQNDNVTSSGPAVLSILILHMRRLPSMLGHRLIASEASHVRPAACKVVCNSMHEIKFGLLQELFSQICAQICVGSKFLSSLLASQHGRHPQHTLLTSISLSELAWGQGAWQPQCESSEDPVRIQCGTSAKPQCETSQTFKKQ